MGQNGEQADKRLGKEAGVYTVTSYVTRCVEVRKIKVDLIKNQCVWSGDRENDWDRGLN